MSQFQSTRPRGARHHAPIALRDFSGFNPRARAGRDSVRVKRHVINFCFNPRARAGRDNQHYITSLD